MPDLININSDIYNKLNELSSLCDAEGKSVVRLISVGSGFLKEQEIERLSYFLWGIYNQIVEAQNKFSPDFNSKYRPPITLRAPRFEEIKEYNVRHTDGTAHPDEDYIDYEFEAEIENLLREYSKYCVTLVRFLKATGGNFYDRGAAQESSTDSIKIQTCVFSADFHRCKILDNNKEVVKSFKFYFRGGSQLRCVVLKELNEKNQNSDRDKCWVTNEDFDINRTIHSLFTKDTDTGEPKQVLDFYNEFIEYGEIDKSSQKKYRLKIPSKTE